METGHSTGLLRQRRRKKAKSDNNNNMRGMQQVETQTFVQEAAPALGVYQPMRRNRPMRTSHLYCLVSSIVAFLAIVTSSGNPSNVPSQYSSQCDNAPIKFQKSRPKPDLLSIGQDEDNSEISQKQAQEIGIAENEHQRVQDNHQNPSHSSGQGVLFPYTFFFNEEKKTRKSSKANGYDLEFNKKSASQNKNKSQQLPMFLRWIDPLGMKLKEILSSNSKPNHDETNESIARDRLDYFKSIPFFSFILSLVDDAILYPNEEGRTTQVFDKIITSTPRLLAIANLLLAVTYLLHSLVADLFLGPTDTNASTFGGNMQNQNMNDLNRNMAADDQRHRRAGRERLGGFLIFKLLLISAVVEPDTLDLLILFSWYTLLSFLRSLSHLAACTTNHTSQAGLPPRRGVSRLLLLVLCCNFTAAACCVALFHGAGIGMVLLLTFDCVLLGLDVLVHLARHVTQVLEEKHSLALSEIEERQIQLQFELLEANHSRRLQILDKLIFIIELMNALLTICHFLHIWSLHGLTCGLVDGVLALHLHTAITAASRKIVERRHMHKISRDLDGFFEDATESEIQKAVASGDVCCICLCTMSVGNVKKLGCGHLYHAHCLREVVERSRSIEAAKCPLCRAPLVQGSHGHIDHNPGDAFRLGTQNNNQDQIDAGLNLNNLPNQVDDMNPQQNPPPHEHALFRFSTEGILPAWLPLPAFSFEVVRRPTVGGDIDAANNNPNTNNNTNNGNAEEDQRARNNDNAPREQSFWRRLLIFTGTVPMSPEEEAAALAQLVDMFPQYDRSALLQELRERLSAEAVVESILMGTFSGVARGNGTNLVVPATENRPEGNNQEGGLLDPANIDQPSGENVNLGI